MFYRISFILGTIISLMFVLFCTYILFIYQSVASEGRSVSALFMIANSFFLLINFICFKINKCNVERRLIPVKLKNAGKFLFVCTIISIVIVLFLVSLHYFHIFILTRLLQKSKDFIFFCLWLYFYYQASFQLLISFTFEKYQEKIVRLLIK